MDSAVKPVERGINQKVRKMARAQNARKENFRTRSRKSAFATPQTARSVFKMNRPPSHTGRHPPAWGTPRWYPTLWADPQLS